VVRLTVAGQLDSSIRRPEMLQKLFVLLQLIEEKVPMSSTVDTALLANSLPGSRDDEHP